MNSDRKKMKICHVITRMIVGGAQENTLFTIIGHLQKGHEVVLLTGPTGGPEGKLLQTPGLPQFETIELPSMVRAINPLQDLKAYYAMKKIFLERKFDVVHTHTSKAGILGRAAAWSARVPVVVHTVHGQAFHSYQSRVSNFIYRMAERFAARRSHKIFTVAQAMIEQCVNAKIGPRELYMVVYSGMEIEKFMNAKPDSALRRRLGVPDNVKVVGAIGRLFPQKGYEYIIPAARRILDARPETHFLIVGDGSMREELKKRIACLGMTDKFHFAGLIQPGEVCRYIALMDVLMHLSLHEGLPRAVVQALAGGKPAVGFALDGTPEVVIPGETGYLAAPENEAEAAAAVTAILNDPELAARMGENGRKLVAERFPWQKMADILENEYEQLLDKTR